MKILFASRYAVIGGIATQLVSRMQYLSNIPNLVVEFAVLEDRGASELLVKYGNMHVADPRQFRELVTSRGFDAIVMLDAAEYLEAVADISSRHCVVVEVHGSQAEALAYLRDRKFSCDTFVVPSRYSRRVLYELGLVSPHEPIEIAPNVIDARLFYPSPSIAHARPIVAWVGRIEEQKDWKSFLLTASVLKESGADLDFWMVGGERTGEAVLEAYWESIDALGLSDRLRWFPRIEYRSMRRFYSAVAASSGCLLSTSRAESFGMALVEALLSGCIVVAPDAGAIGEIAPGASYLSLYDEMEQAARLVQLFVSPDSSSIRAHLETDLPDLRHRFAPETVGASYLAMLMRLVERRRSQAPSSAMVES